MDPTITATPAQPKSDHTIQKIECTLSQKGYQLCIKKQKKKKRRGENECRKKKTMPQKGINAKELDPSGSCADAKHLYKRERGKEFLCRLNKN